MLYSCEVVAKELTLDVFIVALKGHPF